MALGKNQVNALKFLNKHKGWHYFNKDANTIKIVKGLKSYKLINVDKWGRFKITALGQRFVYEKVGERFYV